MLQTLTLLCDTGVEMRKCQVRYRWKIIPRCL